MKDIESTPAAELVGEWKDIGTRYETWDNVNVLCPTQEEGDMFDLIAKELDRRCQNLLIDDGCLVITGRGTVEKWRTWEGHKVKIPAAELHALLGWLLIKGGTA